MALAVAFRYDAWSECRYHGFLASFSGRKCCLGPNRESWPAFGFAEDRDLCDSVCGLPQMAANLSLDPALIERVLELSGERTKKAAVTRALREFIARREQKRLLDLMGKLEWDKAFDYKSERSRS